MDCPAGTAFCRDKCQDVKTCQDKDLDMMKEASTKAPTVVDAITTLDGTTTMLDETTTMLDGTTTMQDGITTMLDETTTVVEETTTMLVGTTAVLDETTKMIDEDTAMLDETTTVLEEITTMLEGTTTVQDEITTVLDETTTMPDETTTYQGYISAANMGAITTPEKATVTSEIFRTNTKIVKDNKISKEKLTEDKIEKMQCQNETTPVSQINGTTKEFEFSSEETAKETPLTENKFLSSGIQRNLPINPSRIPVTAPSTIPSIKNLLIVRNESTEKIAQNSFITTQQPPNKTNIERSNTDRKFYKYINWISENIDYSQTEKQIDVERSRHVKEVTTKSNSKKKSHTNVPYKIDNDETQFEKYIKLVSSKIYQLQSS